MTAVRGVNETTVLTDLDLGTASRVGIPFFRMGREGLLFREGPLPGVVVTESDALPLLVHDVGPFPVGVEFEMAGTRILVTRHRRRIIQGDLALRRVEAELIDAVQVHRMRSESEPVCRIRPDAVGLWSDVEHLDRLLHDDTLFINGTDTHQPLTVVSREEPASRRVGMDVGRIPRRRRGRHDREQARCGIDR